MTLADSDKRLLLLFVIIGGIALLLGFLGGCRGPDEVVGGLSAGRGSTSTDGILNFGPPKAVSLSSDTDIFMVYGEAIWHLTARKVQLVGGQLPPRRTPVMQQVVYLPPDRPLAPKQAPPPEALSAPVSDPALDAPEEPPEDEPVEGSVPWAVAKGLTLLGALLALIRYWPEVRGGLGATWGGIATVWRSIIRRG